MPTRKSRPAARQQKVLVFGESENDTHTLASLLRDLLSGTSISIEPRRRPHLLIRDAALSQIPERVAAIAAIVKAEAVDADVVGVVAHEDCDAVEPAHIGLDRKIRTALEPLGIYVVAAAPAWETETWLMQWPDAFKKHRPSWNSVAKYAGKDVGMIANAKETLRRDLRPKARSVRDYRESDAPLIAGIVKENGWARAPGARSASYSLFTAEVTGLRSSLS